MSVADVLARTNKRIFDQHQEHTAPLVDDMVERGEQRNTLQQSDADAVRARTLLNAADSRNRERHGRSTSESQGEAIRTGNRLDTARARVQGRTESQLADEDFHLRTLQNALAAGNQVRNTADGALNQAADIENRRITANRQAREQAAAERDARSSQLGGTLGSIAGFAVTGGNPVGGAVGGALGEGLF